MHLVIYSFGGLISVQTYLVIYLYMLLKFFCLLSAENTVIFLVRAHNIMNGMTFTCGNELCSLGEGPEQLEV